MYRVALFARLEAKPGKENDVAKFLEAGLAMAKQEPKTPLWFALRLGPTTFGVFDAFRDEDGWRVPANYGDTDSEYALVRDESSGLIDLTSRGRIRVTGSEALMFLNGLVTNDMDETNVVTETNLDDAISYTKGCYLGQEIIVRIKHRGHVAKKLTGLVFEKETAIDSGAPVQSEAGAEIGRVTSATFSPSLGRTVALAYLKYEFLSAGTRVNTNSSGRQVSATVTELPLVSGSWYRD